jgi:hypothetical protein
VSADVTVAVAGDPVEADEIRAVLRRGGIESRLEAAEVVGEAALLDGAIELLEADDDDEDEDDE